MQLLQWDEDRTRFQVVRRLGPLAGLDALALDAEGNLWTPRGSWRWGDSAETPLTLGDVEPYATTQPVVLAGTTICLLKNHYGNVQWARGPLIDSSGWAHLETKGINDLTFDESDAFLLTSSSSPATNGRSWPTP